MILGILIYLLVESINILIHEQSLMLWSCILQPDTQACDSNLLRTNYDAASFLVVLEAWFNMIPLFNGLYAIKNDQITLFIHESLELINQIIFLHHPHLPQNLYLQSWLLAFPGHLKKI